jgi:hypothetical protein
VPDNATKDALNIRAAKAFADATGRMMHWYHASDAMSRNKSIEDEGLIDRLNRMDSGQTSQRLGKIPLVIGMPVMISQNFDVPGGVVNGCSGTLKSVRYRVDAKGRRHAISCVIEAPDTSPGIISGLPDHHVVALEDTVSIEFKHYHSKHTRMIRRTQIPVLPAFAMTAHKSQGKTLEQTVVNLRQCRGTESPYVMISRVTSLDGLLILNSFKKDRITCRQSEEVRNEATRHQILALHTIVETGSPEEVKEAKNKLAGLSHPQDFSTIVSKETDETHIAEDSFVRLTRLERANLMTARANIAPQSFSQSARAPYTAPKRVPRKPISRVAITSTGTVSLSYILVAFNPAFNQRLFRWQDLLQSIINLSCSQILLQQHPWHGRSVN